MKKEDVKSRLKRNKSSQSKDYYKKLAVIGVIVAVVVGLFLFAGLRGVGKAVYSSHQIFSL